MRFRRILSLICCLLLITSVLAPAAFADGNSIIDAEKYDFEKDGIAYKKVGDSTVEVAIYRKITPSDALHPGTQVCSLYDRKEITVPKTVTNEGTEYTVVGLGPGAFISAEPTSVTLPEDAEQFTYISEDAFNACTLTALTIPASVTEIKSGAFAWAAKFTSISFAENSKLKRIEDNVFAGCSGLSSLTLPESVESIGGGVFAGCNALTSVTIPASVTNLDPDVFGASGSVSTPYYGDTHEIKFEEGSKYKIQNGILYDDESLLNVYEIQADVVVPEGIKYIGDRAFRVMPTNAKDNTLKSIKFPSSLVRIGSDAFQRNTGLTSITIPSGVKELGENIFVGCSGITEVTIDAELTEIPAYTFSGTSIQTIKLPDTVTKIGTSAFENCDDLTEIVIPDSVTEIGESAFSTCTSLTKAELPENLETLGESAFFKCKALTAIEIPEGVSKIEEKTFGWCESLKTVVLPQSVTEVGKNAFGKALQGEDAVLVMQGNTPPTFDEKAFGSKGGSGVKPPEGMTVIVPEEAKDSYANGFFKDYFKEDDTGTGTTVSITLEPTSASMKVGGTVNLTCTYTELKNAELKWSSDKEAVATVDNGVVSGVSAGEANITASLMLNGVSVTSATCKVTVTEKSVVPTPDPVRPVNPMYGTSTPSTKHGTVTVSPSRAPSGTLVTITAEPDKGYVLDDLTVTDSKGNSVKLTEKDDGVYTFRMPSGGVTVDAKFVRATSRFVDVADNAWYRDAVEYVYEAGLMNGVGGGKFNPLGETTRGMIVTILYRMEGSPRVYSDGAYWWSDARAWAMEAGVSDGTNMTDNITREQFAAMLYRFASANGIDTSERGNLNRFADSANVSDWAKDAMQWAVAEGIIGGANGKLNPKGLATRAEVAAMFMRFDKLFG